METEQSIERMMIALLWTCWDKIDTSIVNPNWFFDCTYRRIWLDSLKWLNDKGKLDDPIAFDHIYKSEVARILVDYRKFSITEHHFENYVTLLKQENDKLQVYTMLSQVSSDEPEEAIKKVRDWITNYDEKQILNISTHDTKETVLKFMEDMDYKKSLGNTPEFSCGEGFKYLDLKIWGFNRGELVVIASYPGVGKSTLCLNFAKSLLKNGKKVMYFSTEMSASEKIGRFISIVCNIPSWKFRRSDFDLSETSVIQKTLEKISEDNNFLIVDKSKPTIKDIVTSCKRNKPDIVFVDHLQRCNLEPNGMSVNEATENFVNGLKNLARDENIPVICLSQFRKKDSLSNKNPENSELKGSSSIEAEADIIGLLYRDLSYPATEELERLVFEITKNRHGAVGYQKIDFHKNFLRMNECIM